MTVSVSLEDSVSSNVSRAQQERNNILSHLETKRADKEEK